MKTINLIIAVSLMLFVGVLHPIQADASVCQSKTAIVYSNGMFNDWKSANDSKKELTIKVIADPQVSQYLDEFVFYLAYASNNDGLGRSGPAQILEIYLEWAGDKTQNFWRGLVGNDVLPQKVKDTMLAIGGGVNSAAYIIDADFQRQLLGNGTDNNPGYRRLLNEGNRVVIVAHSQGNYYANAIYSKLKAEKTAWGASVGIVAVATPASVVADGRNRHITVSEDWYMAAVIGSLDAVPTLGSSDNMKEFTSAEWANASFGHNFIKWYMAGSFTRNTIINYILNARLDLVPADYSMVPQTVTTGTHVVPAPDGTIYVTKVGGGGGLI